MQQYINYVTTEIKITRLRWAEYILKMDEDYHIRRMIEGKPEGRGRIGRLKEM